MKISDAITELTNLKDKHGDIEIVDSLIGFKKAKYLGEDTGGKWLDRINLVFKDFLA